jgi:Rrf2 family protein
MDTFLSQTAEYALRAMAWLACESPEAPVRARDLSDGAQIPTPYLAKILRRLVLAGVLESRKGQGGGFSLARPLEEITFRDILAAVDAYPAPSRCAFGWGSCDPEHPCPLHESWSLMSEHFQGWASTTTLAAVARAGFRLRYRGLEHGAGGAS